MKLLLKRTQCGKVSTLGELFVDGKPECFVLEDPDRQLEINPDAKVMHDTCIPRGTYQVIVTFSNRFKKELPLLVDVPGFAGVRIHPGNDNRTDSSGCLLPGTSFVSEGEAFKVLNSREAFRRLFLKIEEALDKGDTITIEVT